MRFLDEATITVQSGNGGRGCLSFRREKFIPRGGPDGGDGGDGGAVIIKTSARKRTLYDFRFKQLFKAANGSPGQGRLKAGKKGADLIIEVPPGTLVRDAATGGLLQDLTVVGEETVILPGGRGGRGNARFKSSTNRAPRHYQPGEAGSRLTLKLELKLLADVGIIGLPNAGKSTLIRCLTAAKPKTAPYPFTTLVPNLGVVYPSWGEPLIIADIPGLISGAHQGAGLGTRFLRHIERTRLLVHLIDVCALDPQAPLHNLTTVNQELSRYSQDLAKKPQIVVLNKLDLPNAEKRASLFRDAYRGDGPLLISAQTRMGLDQLLSQIVQQVEKLNASQ